MGKCIWTKIGRYVDEYRYTFSEIIFVNQASAPGKNGVDTVILSHTPNLHFKIKIMNMLVGLESTKTEII